jgi:hypothetical protein
VLAAGLPIQLVGFDAEQNTVERSTRSDAEGRFRFTDLPAPGIYLVRPQADGFSYPGAPVAFRPGEPGTAPPVELSVYDLSEDPADLRVAQVQWVIERDAGVYRVSQRARIANPGLHVVRVGEEQGALLRVGLAPSRGEIATPFDSLPAGVRIEGDIAEVRGPVFPGDEGLVLQVSYDLAAGPDGALDTRIPVPDPVDEVGVYVQDFGVEIDAGALHPARVARQDDVFFQSFMGFELERDTALPLRVMPLPPAHASGTWSAILLAALLAGSLAWLVGWPVASARSRSRPAAPAGADPAAAVLQSALADLEHDYETGKLSAEDRARLEHELRHAPPTPAAAPLPRVCACGHVPAAADRFCAACGSAL